jgi:hypothetical protein
MHEGRLRGLARHGTMGAGKDRGRRDSVACGMPEANGKGG